MICVINVVHSEVGICESVNVTACLGVLLYSVGGHKSCLNPGSPDLFKIK